MKMIIVFTISLLLFFCSCKLFEPLECIDADGNVYKTVKIGRQYWMAENLRTTHYNNGNPITYMPDSIEWINATRPAFCWPFNDSVKYAYEYGAIYNWYVCDTENNGNKNVCPDGWHIPILDDWTKLMKEYGDNYTAPAALLEAGPEHWGKNNTEASNSSGFTAIPSIERDGEKGYFMGGNGALYLCATKHETGFNGYYIVLNAEVLNFSPINFTYGSSIRCIANSKK